MTECAPLQITFTADNKAIIDLETIINKDDIPILLNNLGKDVYLSSVAVTLNNKVTLRLIRVNN